MSDSSLFQPLQVGPLGLANRIVMAPMSRYFCPEEVPHQGVVDYYARRARHGVGLTISEALATWAPRSRKCSAMAVA